MSWGQNYFVSTDWQEILPPKLTKNLFFRKNLSFCHSVLINSNISTKYSNWQKLIFKLYLSVSVIPGFWHQYRLTIRYSVLFEEWRCVIPSIFFSLRPKEMRLFRKRIRDASIYTSKKISLKFLFLSDIFLFPFVRLQVTVLA